MVTKAKLVDHLAHLQAEDFTRHEVKEHGLDFLFKNVITQEVAYETMLYSQRRRLHATIGAVLESRYGNNAGEILDLLAYHYARSDDRHKALYYLQRAGQKVLDDYANEAAVSYFSQALTIAKDIGDVNVQYNLFASRERAYDRLGNRMAQVEDLLQMRKLVVAQDNLRQQLETGNRNLILNTNLGRYQQAITTSQEMLTLAQKYRQSIWEARTLTNNYVASLAAKSEPA